MNKIILIFIFLLSSIKTFAGSGIASLDAAGHVKTNVTASRALVTDVSGSVGASATTSTELGYVSGVTSAIQGQINNKENLLVNSSGLRSALSDETGSGFSMFGSGPTSYSQNLFTPILYGSGSGSGTAGQVWTTNGSGVGSWTTVSGSIAFSSIDKTGSYTILDGDTYSTYNFTGSGSGSGTMSAILPDLASNQGEIITIFNSTTGKGDVLIDPEGTETVNGQTTLSLDFKYSFATIQATTSEWKILSTNLNTGQKTYSEAGGHFTVTSDGTGWATHYSGIIPFKDMNGNWWAHISFSGNHSVALNGPTFTISGLTFKDIATAGAPVPIHCSVHAGTAYVIDAKANENTNTVYCALSSGPVTRFSVEGVVPLNSKPTWVE